MNWCRACGPGPHARVRARKRAARCAATVKDNNNRALDWDSDSGAMRKLLTMRWVHEDDDMISSDEADDCAKLGTTRVRTSNQTRVVDARAPPPDEVTRSKAHALFGGDALGGDAPSEKNALGTRVTCVVDPMTYMWVPPAVGAADVSSTRIRALRARPLDRGASYTSEPVALTAEEDKEKQHKRKQLNRESARRGRLRKQTEHEYLSRRVLALTRENIKFKKEYETLRGVVDSLRAQNITLREELADIRSSGRISTCKK